VPLKHSPANVDDEDVAAAEEGRGSDFGLSVSVLGFRVQGSGSRVQGSGFEVQGSGLIISVIVDEVSEQG
jgi:hypothetical protein